MRKTLLFTFAFIASIGTMYASTQIGDLYYELNSSDQTAVVTKMPSGKYTGAIVVPDKVVSSSVTYNVISIGESAFDYCTDMTAITMPNTLTSIGDYAFNGCSGLTAITIPSELISLGKEAFNGCTGIKTIEIPQKLATIGNWAFNNCSSLTAFTVAKDNNYFSVVDGVLFNKGKTTIVAVPGAKKGSYTIPTSVTAIGYGAFSYCESLTNIVIHKNVISIGEKAFYNCTNLTKITIPDAIKSIEKYTFAYCGKMTSLIIGSAVNNIEKYAFYYCSGLTSITCKATNPPTCFDSGVFGAVDQTIPLYVPENSVSDYQNANVWKLFKDNTFPLEEAIGNVPNNTTSDSHKLIRNGQLYILRDGKTYTIQGQEVK